MGRGKILIIDDSPLCCEFVKRVLGERGFQVVSMTTHFGFVKMLRQELPDVVLVDVTMPSLSGPKLIELARKKRAHACPILLYSILSGQELQELAHACNADGYIEKTSDEDKLCREVDRWLSHSRTRVRTAVVPDEQNPSRSCAGSS